MKRNNESSNVKILSHNGEYVDANTKSPSVELPRLWACVYLPTLQVLGADTLKSRVNALLRIIPPDLRSNYVVWRYDAHSYRIGGRS